MHSVVRLKINTWRLEIALYAQYHATRRATFYSREAEQEMTRPRLLLGVRRAPIEGSHIWPDRDYNVREPGPSPSPQAALRGHPTPPMARGHDHLLSLEQEEQAWGHGWAAGASTSAAANGANLGTGLFAKISLAQCVAAPRAPGLQHAYMQCRRLMLSRVVAACRVGRKLVVCGVLQVAVAVPMLLALMLQPANYQGSSVYLKNQTGVPEKKSGVIVGTLIAVCRKTATS